MKESLLTKLETLCARHEEIAGLLSDIEVINDQDRFRNLSMEYAQLESLVKSFTAYQQAKQALASAREMLTEDDAENNNYEQLFSAIITAQDGGRLISQMFKILPSKAVSVHIFVTILTLSCPY